VSNQAESVESGAVARRFLEAASVGDLATLTALLAEDATWTVPSGFGERVAALAACEAPDAGVTRGREAIVNGFLVPVQMLFEPGSQRMHIDHVVADGERAVALFHADGTVAGGASYHNDFAVAFHVQNGRIASVREYLDTLHAIEAFSGSTA